MGQFFRRDYTQQRVSFYIKLYTLVLIVAVLILGWVFHGQIWQRFDLAAKGIDYHEIYFSVYGGLIGAVMHLLVFLPITFRALKHWSEEDREAHLSWLLLRPLLGGMAGLCSYALLNAMPLQIVGMEAEAGKSSQHFVWLMFCFAVFAGLKSEDFILRFSQKFESLIRLPAKESSRKEQNAKEKDDQDQEPPRFAA